MSVKILRDTKIPTTHIPLIVVHWWFVYYGRDRSVLDMRKFLEAKLRSSFYTRDAVEAWVRNAEGWSILMDMYHPGRVQNYLQEYFQIQLVA
jgi:hypothetical protein